MSNGSNTFTIKNSVFRSYDIRGIYPSEINEEFAKRIGKAFGSYMGKGKKVLVGRDLRISGTSLTEKLVNGVRSTGTNVVYAGMIPTPLLYFAISHYKLDGGISVTASHNPPEWNGFKVCKNDALVIGLGSGLEELREMVKKNSFTKQKGGSMEDRSKQIMADYLDHLEKKVESLDGLSIGIDPGGGAYSEIGSRLLRKKGAEVYPINDTPDGTFSLRSPEPNRESIAPLIEMVKSKGLDIGVAFDGDGDRVIFVTENGKMIAGDIILALLVKEYLKPGEKVVYEISCSSAVEDEIAARKGVPVLTKVGHSHLKENMKLKNCRFGGEISGHIYFQETYGAEDGLFAALKVAELVKRSGKKFSQLVDSLPHYENMYEEFDADDRTKQKVMDAITQSLMLSGQKVDTFEGTKVRTDKGWYLLRVSNTTPKIKCRVEAKSKAEAAKLLETARKEFEAAYKKAK